MQGDGRAASKTPIRINLAKSGLDTPMAEPKASELLIHKDLDGFDKARMKELIERSFGKTLTAGYLEAGQLGLPVELVILERGYQGVVIVMKVEGVPYLDKFAVSPEFQGNGLGRELWDSMRTAYSSMIWRCSKDNPVKGWYLKNSEGNTRSGDWTVFWYGLDSSVAEGLAPKVAAIPQTVLSRPALSAQLASKVWVIKTSGKLCDTQEKIAALAAEVKRLTERGLKVVLPHGGGKQIDAQLAANGIATTKDEEGVRITPLEAMPIISEAVASINKQIGDAIAALGVTVAYSSNTNISLVNGEATNQRTGKVATIEVAALQRLLEKNDVVVLSCLGKDAQGELNINADNVAAAIAQAVGAERLIMLSDVPGVLDGKGRIIPEMTKEIAEALKGCGEISGGMAIKVSQCLDAVAGGVPEVILADGGGALYDVFSGKTGTKFA